VEHLKLPHYVTFGSSLQGTLAMQAERNTKTQDDDHHGIASGQLHHHGDGVLHAHDD
jgi:alpha-D-ribose 1-methylphosphonate 5-triphosphate synthase subunit PhnI